MATLDSFLGLGKRSRTSVDIVKRNNEDGTALSQSKKRKDEESEHQKIPGYFELKILLAASHNFKPDPNYEAASLFLTCQHLIQEVASLAEDNKEPIHRAFSLWNPTLADIGGKQGLVAFRVLWLKLLQVDESSVPGYLLNARKASICAIASKIHTALAAEGLVDDAEVEMDYDPSKDESSALWEDEEDPLGMDIDGLELVESLEQNKKLDPKGKKQTRAKSSTGNHVPVSTFDPLAREAVVADTQPRQYQATSKRRNLVWLFYTIIPKSEAHADVQHGHKDGTVYFKCNHCRWTNRVTRSSNGKLTHLEDHLTRSPRHFKSTGPLFKLLRKKYEDKVPISENEKKKASNEIPITDADVKNSGQQLDILDQLQGMAAHFSDQAFDQLKFDELLVNFFVATDQLFQLTENPHFRDLLLGLFNVTVETADGAGRTAFSATRPATVGTSFPGDGRDWRTAGCRPSSPTLFRRRLRRCETAGCGSRGFNRSLNQQRFV
ncbi:hypothetical protein BT69DRAFT_1378678, partial [Atractiella rhizophila]